MPAPPASRTVTNYNSGPNQGPTGGLGSNYSQTSGYVNTNAGPATRYSGSPQSSGYSPKTGSYGGSTGYAGNASGPRNTGNPGGNYGGSNNSGMGGYGYGGGYDPGVGGVPGGIQGRGVGVPGVPYDTDMAWWDRNRNPYMDAGVGGMPGGVPARGTELNYSGVQNPDRNPARWARESQWQRDVSNTLPSQSLGPSWGGARPSFGFGADRFGAPSQHVSRFTGLNNAFNSFKSGTRGFRW